MAQSILYWVGVALVLPMLNLTGWHLDSDTALGSVQGNVLLTHHPKDGVLTVGCQSHQGSFKSADVVQLTSKTTFKEGAPSPRLPLPRAKMYSTTWWRWLGRWIRGPRSARLSWSPCIVGSAQEMSGLWHPWHRQFATAATAATAATMQRRACPRSFKPPEFTFVVFGVL